MRKARQKSKAGYYHVMIRGVNKQDIFYDELDRIYFKLLMKKFGKKYKIRYHAYVLMDNHVHLLFDDFCDNLSSFMQVLCSVYAKYFNRKYDRIGHLYQDRFASETVENNGYLVVVCRYILLNPQRAGICKASEYKWSSYDSYKKKKSLIYKELIIEMFSSISKFYEYIEENNDDKCLELELRPSEKQAFYVETIKKILKKTNPIIQPDLPRNIILRKLKKLRAAGLSINVISRITGIGKYLVQLSS